ncbi:VOC family protein [Kaistia nematophila]|uniref:VOC family protein n=1 Tax=Kaistia nematophila TaxID=2994654 RepID=A0A9X3E0E6_9HYPH|nr:VOC family protein [Kaistia nematophila]MCX5568816.1 VOC family protein [Kaistia nematophila]
MITIDRLDHLVLTVADIASTCAFYEKALGMTVETFDTGRVALRFGRQKINLHLAGHEFEPKARLATAGSADLCFLTSTPLEDVEAHLARAGVAVEVGPVSRTGAMGAILSVYVRDPDGNLIEISNASRASGAAG